MAGATDIERALDRDDADVPEARSALAALIVATLTLDMSPQDIRPHEPLFGEGLGLDSIDALELALAVSRTYGFELRSDDRRNHEIFASLDSFSRHIQACRTK